MLTRLSDWLDDRTGFRSLLTRTFDDEIVGGAQVVYVFGRALTVLFVCQTVTGLLLMTTYTPSVSGAWASVFYIQHRVTAGWFVRGLHAFGAQVMIIVLGMHLLQVAIYGAYKKPREVTWWFGLALLGLMQAFALTGNPLRWDQRAYWASKIETSIAGTVPLVGRSLQALIVGGSDNGQATLTRFYTLHVGLLPILFIALLIAHVALFRKHGPTPPLRADLSRRERYFPQQAVLDIAFAVLVLLTVAIWTAATGGAPLDAPADAALDYPARPAWYFLFLYKLRIMLPPSLELFATLVLPGIVANFLFALPFLDNKPNTTVLQRLPWLAPLFAIGLGIVGLTVKARHDDHNDAHYVKASAAAWLRAQRSVELAANGVPPGGPLEMLRNDPLTEGPDLYQQQCHACHVLHGTGEYAAPVHTGFASRAWLTGMIHDPQDVRYFGRTNFDDMKSMTEKLDAEQFKAVVEFLYAEGDEPGDAPKNTALVAQGKVVFKDKCQRCHLFAGEGADEFDGPDMTGYASKAWLAKVIKDPKAIYGDDNEMTAFGKDLSDKEVLMLATYLRRERLAEPETGPLHKLPAKRAKKPTHD
jgi:ubiquinol-cytochrome c reductase cytochrome b subunit